MQSVATVTEADFFTAVKQACDKAGIDGDGKQYVEMTCLDNAFDAPKDEIYRAALDTLKWFIDTDDLLAASRNER